jgi:hypothetical protein
MTAGKAKRTRPEANGENSHEQRHHCSCPSDIHLPGRQRTEETKMFPRVRTFANAVRLVDDGSKRGAQQ